MPRIQKYEGWDLIRRTRVFTQWIHRKTSTSQIWTQLHIIFQSLRLRMAYSSRSYFQIFTSSFHIRELHFFFATMRFLKVCFECIYQKLDKISNILTYFWHQSRIGIESYKQLKMKFRKSSCFHIFYSNIFFEFKKNLFEIQCFVYMKFSKRVKAFNYFW